MKKIITLLLALVMLLCFAGCDKKEEAAAPGQENNGTAGSKPAEFIEDAEEDICEMTDSGKHEYEEELISEATCTETGLMMYICLACQKSETRDIPALGHQGSGASCEEPSVCSVCWEIAEEAWGHQEEGGICKYCGIDMMETPNVPQTTLPETTEPVEVETTEAAS